MRIKAFVIALACAALSWGAQLKLWYDRPAQYFEEALVIGNGKIGATIYGGTDVDRLSLNDITLWTGGPDTIVYPSHAEELAAVRQLLLQGDLAAADKANMMLEGHYTENYQPLGNLFIRHKRKGEASNYYRHLDISEAMALTRFEHGGNLAMTEYLASSPDSVIAVRISDAGGLDFSLDFNSLLPYKVEARGDELIADGYAAAHSYPNYYDGLPNDQKHEYDPQRGTRFRTIVKVVAPQSEVKADSAALTVKGGKEAVVLIANETSFNGFDRDPARDGKDYKAIAARNIAKASHKAFDSIRNDHKADYQRLFNRVKLNLGTTAPEIAALPTDRQLLLYTDSLQSNPELEALYFQLGRYLLISSSRTAAVPANLQGLWNEKLLPPWSCNYTSNINLEENYWGSETCNLPEMHESLMGFIANLSTTGSRAAKSFYGVDRGWSLGHNTDIWAMTNPVGLRGGGTDWACWNMGGAWVATHIWEHYSFSKDLDFLREYYPYLKGAAEFCLGWLTEHDGKLLTYPSTSPENRFRTPDGKKVATSIGATSDVAMARECITDAVLAARELGIDADFVAEADQTLAKLQPYNIGAKGQLQEWLEDYAEVDPEHRHQSHLFGLYPGHHISPAKTPELARASHRTLELRGPESTGWSTGWRVNLYARLLDSDMAYATYRKLLKYISPDGYKGPDKRKGGGTYPNLLDAHSPFQIDGNFGGSAGVAEMLVQSDPESITLLPALPAQWREGSVEGLRARGGFEVAMDWKDGMVTKATVGSAKGGSTTLNFNGKSQRLDLQPGQSITIE